LVSDASGATAIAFQPGALTGFPIALPARTQMEFGLKITVPANAKPGDEIKINLVQRDDKRASGGRHHRAGERPPELTANERLDAFDELRSAPPARWWTAYLPSRLTFSI
jgi:hypothetical protein